MIALLPGSRRQEIRLMLESMLKIVSSFGEYQFVIAGAPSISPDFYTDITAGSSVCIITGKPTIFFVIRKQLSSPPEQPPWKRPDGYPTGCML